VEDRWGKLEEIVRRVVREELAAMKLGKQKLGFTNGKWLGITEEQMTVWADAYPSCDLVVELKKAAAWIVSNPHLAPKSQFGRFLNTWFARQQNQLSIRSIPTRNEHGAPLRRPAPAHERLEGSRLADPAKLIKVNGKQVAEFWL
jgi:hypothetical protein